MNPNGHADVVCLALGTLIKIEGFLLNPKPQTSASSLQFGNRRMYVLRVTFY